MKCLSKNSNPRTPIPFVRYFSELKTTVSGSYNNTDLLFDFQAKSDPFDELSSCLSSVFQLSQKGRVEELTPKFVFKKARSIFTHEKFNLKQVRPWFQASTQEINGQGAMVYWIETLILDTGD